MSWIAGVWAAAWLLWAAAPCRRGAAAGSDHKDAAWAKAFLKELLHPTPLKTEVRKRVESLLGQLGDDEWKVRHRASTELLRIGPKAERLVAKALKSADMEVRVRADLLLTAYRDRQEGRSTELARASELLFAAKDKSLFGALIELLSHSDVDLRYVAEYTLRRFSGKQFGYNAHDAAKVREAAARKWRDWWQGARQTFRFEPGRLAPKSAGVITWDIMGREVFIVDPNGKKLWSKTFNKRPYAADALPNGNVLVAFYDKGKSQIEEYTRAGKKVWNCRMEIKGVVQEVRRLANGNTLLTDNHGRRVIEIDAAGRKIVWQYASQLSTLAAAERLPNGNTLVCMYSGQVVEVSKKGKTIWAHDKLSSPRDAQKLANGNVLISEYGRQRVVEVSRAGKEVWTWQQPGTRVVSACRLHDGRTVVHARTKGLLLVSPSSKVIKTLVANRPRSYEKVRLAPAVVKPGGDKSKDEKK